MGQTALRTPAEGIADLESIKALGLRGVMLPGLPPNADYDDPMYDEFWDAVVDLGLPPSFHILTSRQTGDPFGNVRGPRLNSFMTILRANQDIIGVLIFGAVFERHPRLRVVCVEADAGWAPHWMYRADHAYDRHRNWLTAGALSKSPSEYFREHVYLTFQDDWIAFRTVDLMNHERLMWANDFPHSDATWPHSQEMLAEHAAHLDEHVRARILHDNVADLYGIRV
jgi:predicted TIM-barrel fold metal-dependent hydrolase